ncbi:MAG: biotin--[acetyl-CoA-carboxylase] ligase [Stellaceae bacterium]
MTGLAPPPGWPVIRYLVIGSTNDEAKRLAQDGAAARTVVWALRQTKGRGRRGRPWHSPAGNLYASLILRPQVPAARAAQLGFVAALAVGGALDRLCPGLTGLSYKWPNDVLLDGRKLCGILLESEAGDGERPAFLVAGIGINLRAAPQDTEFPATALAERGFPEIVPDAMLAALLAEFERWMGCWERDGFAPVRAAWRTRALLGGSARVRLDRLSLQGRLIDIDEEGALLLLEEGGRRRRISAGEVFPVQD